MQQRIGEKLIEMGLISAEQLEQAVQRQQASGRFLGQVLMEMGAVSEGDLARAVAQQLELPYVDLAAVPVDAAAARLYPAAIARERRCFPYRLADGVLWVAMVNPLDVEALQDLEFVSGCQVEAAIARESDILNAVRKHSPAKRFGTPEEVLQDTDRALERAPGTCQTISILSNKGGVGKSHLAINLATCLARRGKRVLLVDADLGNADLSNKLGIYPKVTLLELLGAEQPPAGLIADTPYGFDLIGGKTGDSRLANLRYLQRVTFIKHFARLAQPYDYMLLDLGAGIATTVVDFCLATDKPIIATTPRDVVAGYACAKVAFLRYVALQRRFLDADPGAQTERFFCPSVVVNRVSYLDQGESVFQRISATARHHLNTRIADYQVMPHYLGGVLYDDDAMLAAEDKRQPVAVLLPRSKPARCFEQITERLVRPLEPPPEPVLWRGLARLARVLRLRPDELDSTASLNEQLA